jgi:sugar phosphate isomerase/epimerase
VSNAGYRYAELGACRIIRDPNLADLGPFSDFEAQEVVLGLRDLRLEISAIECHVEYISRRTADIANAARHTIRVLDIAKHVEVGFVHTVSGRLPPAMAEEDGYRALLAAYRDLLRYAEEAGVKLGIQPVFIYLVSNRASTQRLLEDIGREDLFINFDPSAFVFHRESPVDFIKTFGKKILHVLARDAVVEPLNEAQVARYQAFDMGGGEQFRLALPGEGVVDWPEVIGALQDVGFDGVLSVGLPRGTEAPEQAAANALEFMQQQLPKAEDAGPSDADEALPELGPF